MLFGYQRKSGVKNYYQFLIFFRNSYGNKIGILSAILLFFLSSPAPYILGLGILIKFVLNINLFGGVLIATIFSIFIYGMEV